MRKVAYLLLYLLLVVIFWIIWYFGFFTFITSRAFNALSGAGCFLVDKVRVKAHLFRPKGWPDLVD